MTDCGCKICRFNKTEVVNQMWETTSSLPDILEFLEDSNTKVTEKLLKKHLTNFGFDVSSTIAPVKPLPDDDYLEVILDDIDFSEYDFDPNDGRSILGYLQKVYLHLALINSKSAIRDSVNYLNGMSAFPPTKSLRNLETCQRLYDSVSGINLYGNQATAIKVVESLGYNLNSLTSINATTTPTDTQTTSETE